MPSHVLRLATLRHAALHRRVIHGTARNGASNSHLKGLSDPFLLSLLLELLLLLPF